MISSNELANRIVDKTELSVERKILTDRPVDFFVQWIFFAIVALIPSFISFLRTIKEGDTFLTFFKDYRILYVSFTLALVLFIEQIQHSKFENRHYIYLLVIFIGFAFYILLDNGVSFSSYLEKVNFAYINLCYLITVLLIGFFSMIQKILYLTTMFRRK